MEFLKEFHEIRFGIQGMMQGENIIQAVICQNIEAWALRRSESS